MILQKSLNKFYLNNKKSFHKMLNFMNSSKVVPQNKNFIRVSFYNEKCYKCNQQNFIKYANNEGLFHCKNCNIDVRLFKYIDEKEYLKMMKNDKEIEESKIVKKDSFKNFVSDI